MHMSRPPNQENLMSLADQLIWGMQTYGSLFSFDTFQSRLLWWDDFLGDQLKDEWSTSLVSGGTVAVVDQQTGGIVRLTSTNTDNSGAAMFWDVIRTLLVSKKVTIECRVRLSSTSNIFVCYALFFDTNNQIIFKYDTDDADTNWIIRCRNGGAETVADSGVAPDTNYHVFRIECFPTGEVHFYIDGVETANSPITTNIPPDYLMPYITLRTRTTSIKSIDIDYVVVRQDR